MMLLYLFSVLPWSYAKNLFPFVLDNHGIRIVVSEVWQMKFQKPLVPVFSQLILNRGYE